MKPRASPEQEQQGSGFEDKAKLQTILSGEHPLVKLAQEINGQGFDEAFGVLYSDKGRPGISTRRLVALHYLKYLHDLSDEAVVYGWL